MARGGLKPVVGIYSTFTQRAYDQIVHDVCLQNLPVVLCLDRAGLNGEDGKTHQGVFDISYLSHLPNLTIFAPADEKDFENTLKYALNLNKPVAIRYPKKGEGIFTSDEFNGGEWEKLTEGKSVTVLAVGPRMIKLALELNKACGETISVVCVKRVNPLDTAFLNGLSGTVITLEENVVTGGFGQAVKCYLADNNKNVKVFGFGIQNGFVAHGSIDKQLEYCGLTVENIKKVVFSD
jgi:1-deoxy-D-xylulose-5-phosphate synthase